MHSAIPRCPSPLTTTTTSSSAHPPNHHHHPHPPTHPTNQNTTHYSDPNRVTVFGHGAGATSACLQAILPSQAEGGENQPSRLLTQAAIVESGACYAQPLGEIAAFATHCW